MSWLTTKLATLAGRGKPTQFGYDATVPSTKRKVPAGLLQSEDRELLQEQRRKLISSVRDVRRNYSVAAWMIRRHLDYVSTFSFQPNTGKSKLDKQLKKIIADRSKKENCDVTGRHPLRRMIRMTEAGRVVDGDSSLLKIFDGRLQAIEGDRIRTPIGTPDGFWIPPMSGNPKLATAWIQGIQIDRGGKPLQAAIFNRGLTANLFILDRYVPIKNIYIHANIDRFDQVRGISPLAAAYNSLRDTYESFDYALAKMKVAQLFALAIYRDAAEPFNNTAISANTENDDGESDDGSTDASVGYKIDFGKGPTLLDLDPGDRAEFLESKSPSSEFQQFTQTAIAIALKALDIPYSFFSEDFTNYSGSRLAYLQYEQSAESRREDIRDMLDDLTQWWFTIAIQDGELPGVAIDDLAWTWVHRGMPWLDPLKEIEAELLACDSGFDNEEDVAQRHGKNFYENIDKRARCLAYAEKKGVQLGTMTLTPTAGVQQVTEEPAKPAVQSASQANAANEPVAPTPEKKITAKNAKSAKKAANA